jgi:hypothetical protein
LESLPWAASRCFVDTITAIKNGKKQLQLIDFDFEVIKQKYIAPHGRVAVWLHSLESNTPIYDKKMPLNCSRQALS